MIISAQSFLAGLTWRKKVVDAYQNGDTQPLYSSTTIYGIGQGVQYGYSTYESLIAGNVGNQPNYTPAYSSSATYAIGFCVTNGGSLVNGVLTPKYYQCITTISSGEPFNPLHWAAIVAAPWILRNASFIGATERSKYNSYYLNLTYQLNRYFQWALAANGFIGFRQPPYPAPYDFGASGGVFSDIYITNTPPAGLSFAVGAVGQMLGSVGTIAQPVGVATIDILESETTYSFTIHIPLAVYNALGTTNAIRNSIINGSVSIYAPSGITWIIAPY